MSLDNAAPEVHAVQSEVRPAAERAREHDAAARDPVDPLEVFELIRGIQDPEHPHTLEQLNVAQRRLITVDDARGRVHICFRRRSRTARWRR